MALKSKHEEVWVFTKMALLLSGINIYERKLNRIANLVLDCFLYYFNFVWLYLAIYGELSWFVDGIRNGKSFTELSMIAPCATISILGTVKIHFLFYNKRVILTILDKLRSIHPNNEHELDIEETVDRNETVEDDIIKNEMKSLRIIILLFFSVTVLVLIMFCLSPLALMGYDYLMSGESVVKYPYMVKYGFDIYNTPFWTIIYFHQVWATIIVVVNLFGSDTLFYGLCTYIEMHFKILCHRLENVVSISKVKTRGNLQMIIRRHQELIELVNLTESLYSKSTLFNMVTSSLLICLSGFNITVSKDLRTVLAFVTFLIMSLSQISLMCVFGNMIMASSTDVSNAAYTCHWYSAEQKIKRNILLILMRSAKPCKLTAANFADLNLRAFTTILSRSWSYFALLKTMYD